MKFWKYLLAGFALGTVAIAQEDVFSKLINKATTATWNILPDKPNPKYFEVKGIPGEHAFRVKATKGVNPRGVPASSPVQGAINEGDVIMLAYYARAAEPAEGGSKLSARIQMNAPPWTAVLDMSSAINEEWKQYCAHRVANASLAENKSSVSIHLATAKQVIELGPVFVFNFGKDYDRKKLDFCDG